MNRHQTDTGENINLLGGGNKAGLLVVLDYATVGTGHYDAWVLTESSVVMEYLERSDANPTVGSEPLKRAGAGAGAPLTTAATAFFRREARTRRTTVTTMMTTSAASRTPRTTPSAVVTAV